MKTGYKTLSDVIKYLKAFILICFMLRILGCFEYCHILFSETDTKLPVQTANPKVKNVTV